MGIYMPNTEIPKVGYVTVEIHSDGRVVKKREFENGTLRIVSQEVGTAVTMNLKEKKEKTA